MGVLLLDRRRALAGVAGAAAFGLVPPARGGVTGDSRLFNGELYGWPFPADSIRSARWMHGRRLAARFRCDRSGTVTRLLWLLRLGRSGEREGRYSARDGGHVHIELRRTLRDGYPAQGWPDLHPRGLLACTAINGGAQGPLAGLHPDGGPVWLDWELDRPVELRAGAVLHALFVPHEVRSWAAINCHGQAAPPPLGSGLFGGPYYRDDFVVQRETGEGTGRFASLAAPSGPTTPTLFLRYTDGMLLGPPAAGSWPGARQPVGGRYAARQVFTLADRERLVDGVWLRVWTEGEAPAPLVVELRRGAESGSTLESMPVPAHLLPAGPPMEGGPAVPMRLVAFHQPIRLLAGETYELRLHARRRGYATNAVRHLSERDGIDLDAMRDRLGPEHGRAELSQDGGASWERWAVAALAPDPHEEMALPVAFTTVR